jgi:hypothetical protein
MGSTQRPIPDDVNRHLIILLQQCLLKIRSPSVQNSGLSQLTWQDQGGTKPAWYYLTSQTWTWSINMTMILQTLLFPILWAEMATSRHCPVKQIIYLNKNLITRWQINSILLKRKLYIVNWSGKTNNELVSCADKGRAKMSRGNVIPQ